MILSTSHNFIFVHVPKTAGTAMTAALEPFAVGGTRTRWRRFLRRLPLHEAPARAYYRKHETAAAMRRRMTPAVFDAFFRFTVVRNPFDHAVSHYEYLKEFRNARLAARFAAMPFADYLRHRLEPGHWRDRAFIRLPDQAHFLVDGGGRLLVQRLMRFETLADDFARLAADLGLGGLRMERINPTRARADKRPFQSYYDAETEDLLRRLYARDFALLGYSADLPG